VHAKGLDKSLGEIRVIAFIAERVLMSSLWLVADALVKSGISLLPGKGGDAAARASRCGRETARRRRGNQKKIG